MIPDNDQQRAMRGRWLTFGPPLIASAVTISLATIESFSPAPFSVPLWFGVFALSALLSVVGPMLGGMHYAGRADGLAVRILLATVFGAIGLVLYGTVVFLIAAAAFDSI